jgi:hypothetical protein
MHANALRHYNKCTFPMSYVIPWAQNQLEAQRKSAIRSAFERLRPNPNCDRRGDEPFVARHAIIYVAEKDQKCVW